MMGAILQVLLCDCRRSLFFKFRFPSRPATCRRRMLLWSSMLEDNSGSASRALERALWGAPKRRERVCVHGIRFGIFRSQGHLAINIILRILHSIVPPPDWTARAYNNAGMIRFFQGCNSRQMTYERADASFERGSSTKGSDSTLSEAPSVSAKIQISDPPLEAALRLAKAAGAVSERTHTAWLRAPVPIDEPALGLGAETFLTGREWKRRRTDNAGRDPATLHLSNEAID